MPRTVMRLPDILRATGWSRSTVYSKIAEGKFPRPTRLDPTGRVTVWFSDQVEAFQKAAVERQAQQHAETGQAA